MPEPDNILRADDSGRDVGLVYRHDALSAGPAAHVLVIGVAAYRSPEFTKLLNTATISAREVADWFVDGAKARFSNPDCGLGSVAVLLSETPDNAKSTYAGGKIPRATFASAKEAVRAWVGRLSTHKDNLAILYVASHGESFLNRTAFLLEDYGMDQFDATAGMSEVEQFISALENATPVPQLLLFDCCRNPASVQFPCTEVIGNKLIALTRQPNDHGEPRKQWVICSTSLGEYAGGLAIGPTLFNMALIDALNGVASDTSARDWPVHPGQLVDKIDRILALHRLPDEKAQTPAGRLSGSFDITFPGEKEKVPVYISINDPAQWPGSMIGITVDGNPKNTIIGEDGQSPFYVCEVPVLAEVQVEITRDHAILGNAKRKVYPPAVFLEVEKSGADFATEIGQLSQSHRKDKSRCGEAKAQLVINVASPLFVSKGAVATVVRRGKPGKKPKEIVVKLGGETKVDLRPGQHHVTLRTPDGRRQAHEVTLTKGQILQVDFATQHSPHEWTRSATIAGAIREPGAQRVSTTARLSFRHALDISNVIAREPSISTEIAGAVAISNINIRQVADVKMRLVNGPDDGRFLRLDVQDEVPSRFIREMPAETPPVFARVTMPDGRVELAVVPSLGSEVSGGWNPYLLVDRQAAVNEHLTAVIVKDQTWASLLGFLGSRDFAMGAMLLDSGLGDSAVAAMQDKLSNPLAAVAGALIAVAAASPDTEKRWDPWLGNLANWFTNIPDGPIILARRRLVRARTAAHLAEARRWFVEGYKRGVPFYSLSVDWLARGLESIPADDIELAEMRKCARQLSNRVDPTSTFTVIRASN
jgi:hypothetical protein